MKHNSFATLALCAFGALAVPAAAQGQGGQVLAQPPATVNLDFKGGKLSDLIAALRAAGERVNIVAPDTAVEVPVPAMQLRGVTVESALRAAATVVEAPYDIAVQPILQPPGGPVLALTIREVGRNLLAATTSTGPTPANDVRVFSLRMLTKPLPGEADSVVLPIDTVLTAIDTGLAIVDPKVRPTIKFHEDSGLLFVSGTPQQIGIVHSALGQLEASVQNARVAVARKSTSATAAPRTDGERKDDDPKDKKPVR